MTIQWISANNTNYAIHWIVIYPVDSVIHPLNNWAVKFTKLFSTHNYFSYEQSFLPACFVLKIKSIENSMEGQRSFRGFRSRNGSKLQNLSPERATKQYKYGTSGPRRRHGEPGEGFGKKTARTTFSSIPNIRKLIFLVSRAGTDPFLVQRTINTCCKWRESTCAFIQCGQLQHPIYPTVSPTPSFFLYEFL